MSRKQSQFIEIDEVPGGYELPVFGNGVNRSISIENFLNQIRNESVVKFIYPTIESLRASDLSPDLDEPIYVRVEETEFRLYKITNLAPGPNDIPLDNGSTATVQQEYSEIGFVVGPSTSVDGAIPVFNGTTGTQLENGPIIGDIGHALIESDTVSDTSFIKINPDSSVIMRNTTQMQDDLGISNRIVGPSSSGNDQVALFDGATGKLLKAGQTLSQYFTSYLNDFLVTLYNIFPRKINTFADLASTPASPGQIVYLKEYNAGTGMGGGQLVAQSGAITPDNVTTFASATVGVYFERIGLVALFVEHAGGIPAPEFNNTPAIQRAMSAFPWSGSAANSGGTLHFGPGIYEYSPFTVNRPITFKGAGKYSTTLLKNAPGVGINFELDTSAGGGLEDLAVVKKAGVADTVNHHGVVLGNGRAHVKNILTERHGGIGTVIQNNNCSFFLGVESNFNGSHGLAVIGQPSPNNNANGLVVINADCKANSGSGIYLENCFANTFIAPSCQANSRYAVELGILTQLHHFIGIYAEANTLGAGLLNANTNGCTLDYNIVEDAINPIDNGTNNSIILRDDDSFGYQQVNPIKTPSVQIGNPSALAPGVLKMYDTGTQYSVALQGTGANVILEFLSEGAGTLTTKFQKLYEDSLALTLQNSWVNGAGLGVPTIYKDSTGRVFLSGGIQGGTTTSGTVVATIPSQYRPGVARRVISANSAGIVIFNITAGGNIVFDSGTNALITLDGLNWHL